MQDQYDIIKVKSCCWHVYTQVVQNYVASCWAVCHCQSKSAYMITCTNACMNFVIYLWQLTICMYFITREDRAWITLPCLSLLSPFSLVLSLSSPLFSLPPPISLSAMIHIKLNHSIICSSYIYQSICSTKKLLMRMNLAVLEWVWFIVSSIFNKTFRIGMSIGHIAVLERY